MIYCLKHMRVILPGGWDSPKRAYVENTWIPLSPNTFQWAQRAASAFSKHVQLTDTPCDMCMKEDAHAR